MEERLKRLTERKSEMALMMMTKNMKVVVKLKFVKVKTKLDSCRFSALVRKKVLKKDKIMKILTTVN